MTSIFVLLAAAGFAATVFAPVPKDRMKRMLSQGACTSAITVGLFGSLFQLISY
ncbi:MAG TPA: hypothetical protein VLA37_11555 [Sphingomonadaceae bacterium]|nr:hypothetical protein [Sphingomonadaceae bacterium]